MTVNEKLLCYDCFDGDTNIFMSDGSSKEIKNVCIGDAVFTPSPGVIRVIDIEKGYEENILELKTKNNLTLLLTLEHPVKTPRGLVFAKDLTAGDTVNTVDGFDTVAFLKIRSWDDLVYSIYFDSCTTFYANNIEVGDAELANELFRSSSEK